MEGLPSATECPINAVTTYHGVLLPGAREDVQWRFITTNDVTRVSGGAGALQHGRYDLPYAPLAAEGAFTLDGAYSTSVVATDAARWGLDPRLATSYPLPLGSPAQFNGVIWTHTASLGVGTATTDCGDPVSNCGGACAGALECRLMPAPVERVANHYWSRSVVAPITISIPTAVPCVHAFGPIVGDAGCPYCANFFPELYAGWVGTSFDPQCENFGSLVGTLAGSMGIAGTTLHIPIFDPAIFPDSSLRLIAAAESTPWLGPTGIRYVSLDAANTPVSFVVAQLGKLESVPACTSQLCGPALVVGGPAPASRAAAAAVTGSAYVLSARRETLYLIGGDAPSGPVSSIQAFDGGWRTLPPPSVVLGHILAATYSPEADALLVLDDRTVAHRRVARLLRIDPESGDTVVLAEYPRIGGTDRFSMAAGNGDHLFVAASAGGAHVVLELDAQGQPRRIVAGVGRLEGAPVHASDLGLSVVVSSHTGPRTIGYEWSRFRPGGGRMAERCF